MSTEEFKKFERAFWGYVKLCFGGSMLLVGLGFIVMYPYMGSFSITTPELCNKQYHSRIDLERYLLTDTTFWEEFNNSSVWTGRTNFGYYIDIGDYTNQPHLRFTNYNRALPLVMRCYEGTFFYGLDIDVRPYHKRLLHLEDLGIIGIENENNVYRIHSALVDSSYEALVVADTSYYDKRYKSNQSYFKGRFCKNTYYQIYYLYSESKTALDRQVHEYAKQRTIRRISDKLYAYRQLEEVACLSNIPPDCMLWGH